MPTETHKVETALTIYEVDSDTGEILSQKPKLAVIKAMTTAYENTEKLFFKTPNNHDTLAEAQRHGTVCLEKTLAQQNTRDEVDINNILAKFGIADTARQSVRFLDIPDDFDMQTALANLKAGEAAFRELPPQIQHHFGDITNLLSYVDQAIATGDKRALQEITLIPPDPRPEPPPAAPGAPSASQGGSPAPSSATPPK